MFEVYKNTVENKCLKGRLSNLGITDAVSCSWQVSFTVCTADGVVSEVRTSGGSTAGSADHAGITTTGVTLATSGAAHTTGASIVGQTALPAFS